VTENRACVLLADDDPDYLWLLQAHLQIRGYKVLVAQDGTGALEKAATKELNLLILDVQMPGIDGCAVCQRIRLLILDVQMPGIDGCAVCQRIREFSNVPVILLSGLSTPAAVVRGLDAGADDYLTKPVSIEELVSRMGALLQRAARPKQPKIASQRETTALVY
jgi:DNA-binding response OmpR family regulator